MKSASEILKMLVNELLVHIESGGRIEKNQGFYNQALGDTSFLLAGLLEVLLKENLREWDSETNWLDDTLITSVRLLENKLILAGVVIWGTQGTTEQWVDPFSFEMYPLLDGDRKRHFKFSFCNDKKSAITYHDYMAKPSLKENEENISWTYTLDSDKLDLSEK